MKKNGTTHSNNQYYPKKKRIIQRTCRPTYAYSLTIISKKEPLLLNTRNSRCGRGCPLADGFHGVVLADLDAAVEVGDGAGDTIMWWDE